MAEPAGGPVRGWPTPRRIARIRWGYHLALRFGAMRRRRAARALSAVAGPIAPARVLPFTLVTLLGVDGLPEGVRALRSFFRHAGRPGRVRVASDGTLDDTHLRGLSAACGVPDVPFEFLTPVALPSFVSAATAAHPMMRKLAVMMSLPAGPGPCLYADSDVVWFPAANRLGDDLAALRDRPAYLRDCKASFDPRIATENTDVDPVNGGLLWFPRPLDFRRALERLRGLPPGFTPTHFTEQACVHLAMHDSGATAFDADAYVLKIDDQFEWRDRYAQRPGTVCRHYVRPVRHKMWLLPRD